MRKKELLLYLSLISTYDFVHVLAMLESCSSVARKYVSSFSQFCTSHTSSFQLLHQSSKCVLCAHHHNQVSKFHLLLPNGPPIFLWKGTWKGYTKVKPNVLFFSIQIIILHNCQRCLKRHFIAVSLLGSSMALFRIWQILSQIKNLIIFYLIMIILIWMQKSGEIFKLTFQLHTIYFIKY